MNSPSEQRDKPKEDVTLWYVIGLGVVWPYLARVPGTFIHGHKWLTSYFPSLEGVVFFGIFNLIPWGALALLRASYRNSVIPFWSAAAAALCFLFYVHSRLDLAADAQAAIALVFIPIYSVGAVLLGWGAGLIIQWIRKR
ncbi:MAG TPA: hypothetical protein VM571_08455 [Noviherbaspirillum sp.]|nr:hypothetical protein [Noviherbaspirillum sp.]